MVAKLENRRIRVGKIDLDLLEGGSGQTLLFLHGAEGPDTYSATYLETLAESFRVIAPWHPGFGHSSRPTEFTEIGDLAYFYLDLIRQRKLRDIVLVGSSFGGWIAMEMVIRASETVDRLVLAAPFGVKIGGREERDFTDLFLVSAPDWPHHQVANPAHLPDYAALSEQQLEGIARSREALATYGWSPYLHSPLLKRWLGRIRLPTLVLWGEADRMARPGMAPALTALIDGAVLCTIPGAGHLCQVDAPAEFARLVGDFTQTRKSAAA